MLSRKKDLERDREKEAEIEAEKLVSRMPEDARKRMMDVFGVDTEDDAVMFQTLQIWKGYLDQDVEHAKLSDFKLLKNQLTTYNTRYQEALKRRVRPPQE